MIVIEENVSIAMRKVQEKVIDKFKNEISRILLFGSHAKGTQTSNSDIDIMILSKNLICNISILEFLWELSDKLIKEGYNVHLVFENEECYLQECEGLYKNVRKYGFTYFSNEQSSNVFN